MVYNVIVMFLKLGGTQKPKFHKQLSNMVTQMVHNHGFEKVWAVFGTDRASWSRLGGDLVRLGGVMVRPGGVLEHLGSFLVRLGAPSWVDTGPAWRRLAASWCVLKASLGRLGTS